MVESSHRIRLLGSWSLSCREIGSHQPNISTTDGPSTECVLARRFHAPTGLRSNDQVLVKWILAADRKQMGARLNNQAIQVASMGEERYESQNILAVLQPSNEVQIILEGWCDESHRLESHVVPSADSKWLKAVWLEIVSC